MLRDPVPEQQAEAGTAAGASSSSAVPEAGLLSRFAFVDADDDADQVPHLHDAACRCQLRGV